MISLIFTERHRVMKLSVIIPVYNGAKTIKTLVQAVAQELSARLDLEVVLINDGSSDDNSAEICQEIAEKNSFIKFLNLSRNFGEHNAVMAGLNFCTGDSAVIIDDDFQNPPSEIGRLVDRLTEGYDVVFSRYDKKKHNLFRNFGSKLHNLIASILIGKPVGLYLSSFKAINRFVINELIKYGGPYPYIDGLILRVTQNYSTLTVRHEHRKEGKSGYTIHKLLSLWFNMFTSFSILPLRFAMLLGFVFALLGFIGAIVFFIERIQNPNLPLGWATLIISLFIISGVQLLGLGMIGEYLGRMFLKDSGKPQFVVRNTVNCMENNDEEDRYS